MTDTETCRVFLLCENPATTVHTSAHAGQVPACQRCADKMGRLNRMDDVLNRHRQ